MIDGADPSRATVFRDENGPAGTVDRVHVQIGVGDVRVFVRGVDLYTLADGGVDDGPHAVSRFRLIGDTGGPGGIPDDIVLVDDVNPRDDGAANRYFFEPVMLRGFLAEFTRSTATGPRVIEIDAVAVPEPSAAAVLAAAGLTFLRRQRRARP